MSTTPRKKTPAGAGGVTFDRTPPSSIEAERSVLGSIVISPQAVGQAVEILGESGEAAFYVPAHQFIYNACVALHKRNYPVDLVTLTDELARNGQLDAVGGATYLSELSGVAPTSANLEYYARMVQDTAVLRSLITVCGNVSAQAYSHEESADVVLGQAEKDVFELSQRRQTSQVHPLNALLNEGVRQLEEKIKNKTSITGVPTGYPDLDKLLSGLQPSDMVVLAARPSLGKTALALNIAANAAMQQGKRVLIFSLEMAKEQLVQRLLCMVCGINSQNLRDGFLADREFPKVQAACQDLMSAQIFIDESAGLTPLELRSKARKTALGLKATEDRPAGLDLVIIDYLQLMHIAGRQSESRQTEISEISRAIKGLARELHAPVLALSQLSREAEKDDNGTPKLSHLRESGAIEQDADVVMILSRPPLKERTADRENVMWVNIAKQRNGPTGRIELLFQRNLQRFVSLASGPDGHAAAHTAPSQVPDAFDMESAAAYGEDEVPF